MSDVGLLPLHGLAGAPLVMLPQTEELGLGRDPGGTGIKIADPRCSRRHAVVYFRDGEWYLRDLDSKNGSWVNGIQVKGDRKLTRGDHLRIGHAEFAFTGKDEAYRCCSCLRTLVAAAPEAPFCTECRRAFPLLGSTLAQRRLVKGLGTGSFGSVYLGHRRGNPYVALKVLHVEFTEEPNVVLKFLKEAYATAGLEHENIVRFGDSGHEAGHWFLILEYFPSKSLREILEEQPFLPVPEGLAIAKQVLSALEYAHERKVLHRDVKPGNILVSDDGQVKVVDFGLAKRLVDAAFTQQTSTGTPGTPLFMAPELLGGGQATFKADIYSTAATIYKMLTGRHPIEAKRLNDWLVAVQSQSPPLAKEIQPSIPDKVSAALARALDRDPDRRQPTMRDFRKDLLG